MTGKLDLAQTPHDMFAKIAIACSYLPYAPDFR